MPGAQEYAFAFAEGRRSIDNQAAQLTDVRDRASAVMTVAAAIAAIAAGLAPDELQLEWWGTAGIILGVGGLVVCAVAAASIWAPTPRMVVNLSPTTIVGSYIEAEAPADMVEMHRELALHLGNHVEANTEVIEHRLTWFSRQLLALGLQVAGLCITLVDIR